jgi:hypothetical protein
METFENQGYKRAVLVLLRDVGHADVGEYVGKLWFYSDRRIVLNILT